MKKLILSHTGEEDIRPSIVIIITDGDADAIALAFHSGFLRNVGESAVVVIVEEAVPILGRIFFQRWDGCAIDEVNIQVAVIIVIEKRHTGEHRLGQVLIRRRAIVRHEMNTGAVRDFLECDRSRRGHRHQSQNRPEERED